MAEKASARAGDGVTVLPELFRAQVERTPGSVAVLSDGLQLTYRQLDAAADGVAGRLRALGVGPDTVVGLCVERTPRMLVGLLGILKAGGAYLPLDPAYPSSRLELMLEESSAPVVVADPALANRLPWTGAKLLVLGPEDAAGTAPDAATWVPPAPPGGENLAYLLYTSGSTGRPKGVLVTHRGLAGAIASVRALVGIEPSDRVLAMTSLSFDIAAVEMFVPLLVGGSVFIAGDLERRTGSALAAALSRSGASVVQATPSTFRMLLESGWQPSRLKLISGGEALAPALAARLQAAGARLWNGYGPSETAIYSTFHVVEAGGPVAIGRPLANTFVRVLDARLDPVRPGLSGELYIGGAGVARGYLGRPGLTAERFLPDPFGSPGSRMYRTGDGVRELPDGNLDFLGRLDHQVKIRGHRVELGEVEAVLAGHEAISAAAARLHRDGAGGARLVAYLELRRPVRVSEVRRWLLDRVPEFMVPAALVVLERLPLTTSGKLDRQALPPPARARPELDTGFVPPRDALEEALVEMWEEVLDVQPVGVEDALPDLGGDSLDATRLIARIHERFGVELEFASFLSSLTVAAAGQRLAPGRTPPPRPSQEGASEHRPSSAQLGVWFQEQLDPGTPVFNIPLAYRLRGPLDPAALERSLRDVVLRYRSLRTRFQAGEGRPVPFVDADPPFALAGTDLSLVPDAARAGRLAELMRVEAQTPFDLATSPLVRGRLVRCQADEHVLLLTLHHIVSDAWSVSVIAEEVGRLYPAHRDGRPRAGLLSPPPPVCDAGWQDDRLRRGELDQQLRRCRERLAGVEQLALPADAPRPAGQTFEGARHSGGVGAEASRRLKELGRGHGATLFMTLLAVFKVLLHRLSGQDDIAVGAPVAWRARAGLERSVGLFVNLLVVRTDLGGNPSFTRLLERVKQGAVDAFRDQDVPFERLVDELRPRRDPSRTPLFQVLFNMYNFPSWDLRLDGLAVEALVPPMAGSLFDLTLYAREEAGELRFDLVYNPGVFAPERMRHLLDQYVHLLHQVCQAPSARIDDLSLVTPEARRVLPDPAEPLGSAEDEGPITSMLRRHAAARPGAVALQAEEGAWTYRELTQRSEGLARRLVAAGLTGKVVGIWGRRGPELVCALAGALQAGAAFLMLDPAYPAARLAHQLRQAGARAWICAGGRDEPGGEVAAALAAAPGFAVGGEPGEPWPDLPEPDLDRAAYVAFTSGSTGRPKGVVGSERPVAHFLRWHAGQFGLGPRDRFSLLSGLAYDPLLRDVFTPLWLGATLCIPGPETLADPGRAARWLADSQVTVVHATPQLLRLLLSADVRFDSLRLVCAGGDVLTSEDSRRLRSLAPGARLVNFYGATETPQAVAWCAVEEDGAVARERVPIGSGIAGVQLLLLNRAGGQAGVGELAEIGVRSRHLALGYLDDDRLTRERFPANPLARTGDRVYLTGDLGRYLPDGRVELVGRADDQVQVRGFRVELGEVEASLRRLEGIVEAAAAAPLDPGGERRLVAYLVGEARARATLPEVRRRLQAWLPEYMLPSALVLLDALPRLPNGKLDRRRLPPPEVPRPELDPGYVMPGTPTERAIAQVWCQVLGLARVGTRNNFFDLGGNSLAIAEVHARLQRVLRAEVSIVELFRHPDIESLARHLDRGETAADPALRRIAARRASQARRMRARASVIPERRSRAAVLPGQP